MNSKLAETEFSNPNYRSENLKVNFEKTYGKKILVMFIKMETHKSFNERFHYIESLCAPSQCDFVAL
jgi:hypothetical protein